MMYIIFQSFPALSTDTSFDFGQTVVTAYWEIGEQIYKACGENDRAEYGKHLLRFLSRQLTSEFGKGFCVANLKNMRQFYCMFPIRYTLCSEWGWSHYRLLMWIADEKERALIDHLQQFLPELGRVFSFVARQKHHCL